MLSHLKIGNVTIILDINNNIILGDTKKCLNLGDIKPSFEEVDTKNDNLSKEKTLKQKILTPLFYTPSMICYIVYKNSN